jgi:desulfoferrodoxin (superoxide reductase-like protein)
VTVLVNHVMGANGIDAGTTYVDAGTDARADAGRVVDSGVRDATADAAKEGGTTTTTTTTVHYITTIYLKSSAGVVVGLWEFASSDPAPPTVVFTLPAGVTSVTAHEFCTLHGLWAADALTVG